MVLAKGNVVLGLGLALLLAGVARSGAAGPLVWEEGFENGVVDLDRWNVKGDAPAVQSKITRSGKYAAKFVLNRLTSGDNNRAELRAKASSPTWFVDAWYGFSIYLQSPYPSDELLESLANWHGVWDKDLGEGAVPGEGQGGAPLSLRTKDGKWVIERQWDPGSVSTKDTGGHKTHDLGPYNGDLDKWTDWVVRVHWDYRTSGNGRVTLWKNGVQVLNVDGPVGRNDAVAPYFKWGIYKPAWKNYVSEFGNERVAYHDEFRMAVGPTAKYEDVAPGPKAAVPDPPASVVAN